MIEERSQKPIRVLLVERQRLVRSSLRQVIDSDENLRVIGEAWAPEQALLLVADLQPNVILIDPNLEGKPDCDLIARLSEVSPDSKVIVLTEIDNPAFYLLCIQNGAQGIFLKEDSCELLIKAIEKVHAGEAWLNRNMMASVLEHFQLIRQNSFEIDQKAAKDQLSPRELEIVRLVCQCLKGKQIAEKMNLSEITVRHHLTAIYRKLGVTDRLDLVIFAFAQGMVEPPG